MMQPSQSYSSSSSKGFLPTLRMTTDRVLETVPSLRLKTPKTFEDEDDDENEYDCATRKHG
jgi:hypothetical protein